MYFLFIGCVLLALKYFAIEPVGSLQWWIVLSPFAMAVGWWWWADSSGYTKRMAIEKIDKRKKDRLAKQRDAMGVFPKKRK